MFGLVRELLAVGGAGAAGLDHFHVLVGIGERALPAPGQFRVQAQFHALGAGLADLDGTGAVVGVGHQFVVPLDTECGHTGGQQLVVRLVAKTRLVLAGRDRVIGFTGHCILAVLRAEGFRVADVGRKATRDEVDEPGPVAELGLVLGAGVGLFRDVVIAAAERCGPALPDLQVVLEVESNLIRFGAGDFEIGRRGEIPAVVRVIEVQGFIQTILEAAVTAVVGEGLVVHPHQELVVNAAGNRVNDESGIRGQRIALVETCPVITVQGPAVGLQVGPEVIPERIQDIVLDRPVPQVLVKGDAVGQLMVEQHLNAVLLGIVAVKAGFADVAAVGNPAVLAGFLGALAGEGGPGIAGFVPLVTGEQRQAGIVVRFPGQRRGYVDPVIVDVVNVGVGFLNQTGQAVTQRPVIAEGIADVAGDLAMVVTAVLNTDFRKGLVGGLLAHHVDDASGLALAVEHGGRPPQDLDALQAVEFHRAVVGQTRLPLGAVEVGGVRGGEATDLGVVGIDHTRARPVGGVDARTVGHGLGQVLTPPILHLLPGDHADRLGALNQRDIRLGGGPGALGYVALNRPVRAFPFGGDGDGGQVRQLFFLRVLRLGRVAHPGDSQGDEGDAPGKTGSGSE